MVVPKTKRNARYTVSDKRLEQACEGSLRDDDPLLTVLTPGGRTDLWHGRLSRAHTHVMSSSYFILNGYGLSLQKQLRKTSPTIK